MTGFVKVYGSIIMSSVWEEAAHVKVVWITMLALADQNGYVGASKKALATMARVSPEELKEALDCFLSPDDDSRSQDYEGRRIEVADRGWRLLNYEKFREMRTESQVKKAEAQARWRGKARSTVDDGDDRKQKQKQKQKTEEDPETNTPLTPQGGDGGASQELDLQKQWFERFWKIYPKKDSKPGCWGCWVDKKISDQDFSDIMEGLEYLMDCDQWKKQDGKMIPNAMTFVNRSKWHERPKNKSRLEGDGTFHGLEEDERGALAE